MKDYCFSKQERLCKRNDFQVLLTEGQSVYVYPFRCVYLWKESSAFLVRIAVAASKKKFKRSVDRNKIKRLVREGYRLEKQLLYQQYKEKYQNLDLLIIYTETKIFPFSVFRRSISNLINKLIKEKRKESL
jgi:ribonuclease P protein component